MDGYGEAAGQGDLRFEPAGLVDRSPIDSDDAQPSALVEADGVEVVVGSAQPTATAPALRCTPVPMPVLDELMANAWQPIVVETYGGWRYRWAEGVTRRANSALARPTGPKDDVSELVDRAEAFYAERSSPTLIQVSTASAPRGLVPVLQARGYHSTARTLVEKAATQDVVDRTAPTIPTEVAEVPSDDWLGSYWSVESIRARGGNDLAVYRDFLLKPGLPAAFVTARQGSKVVGVGQVVFERGWGGVQCMATDSGCRRQGVAKAVLNALAKEALRREARQIYLAVMASNRAAVALYGGAGFVAVHEYEYFTGPQAHRHDRDIATG